ncbi:MAG: Ig-like domain-containing protein, partial [Armatimonadota bacterium]
LTAEPRILHTYSRLVSRPYFLSRVYAPPPVIATAPQPTEPSGRSSEQKPSAWPTLPPRPEHGVAILLMGGRGDTLSGTAVVVADVGSQEEVGSVAFYVDGRFRTLTNTKPYRYEWDTTRVADGAHTLKVVLFDESQVRSAQDTMLVAVENQ